MIRTSNGGYRWEATSLEGFIQQLSVSYLKNGYVFYVTGWVPEGKDPRLVDAKLMDRYGVGVSKWTRARRKRLGQANVHYLRHERFFVLLATHGEHRFFSEEAKVIRDAREVPIQYGGYAVSYRGGHAHVRIEQGVYQQLKAYFLERALHRSGEALVKELRELRFEPYAPVRRQLLGLLRVVNRARKQAGYEVLGREVFRLRRRVVKVFEGAEKLGRATAEEAIRMNLVRPQNNNCLCICFVSCEGILMRE